MDKSLNYLKEILIQWQNSVLDQLPKILLAIIILLLFVFFAKVAKKITLNFYTKTIKAHSEIANFFSSVIYFFFILSGVFIALQLAGLEKLLTHVLAGAGIIGIIAGFAFKDVASNIFAGLLLKIQNPYTVDDWVEIDGNYGVVTQVGWITTKIKTVPGQEVFVPNQLVYSNTFTNYSTLKKRRIIFKTGVAYGDDLDRVKATALDEVYKIPELLKDEDVDFYFTEIGNSSYNFQLRFWIHFNNNKDYQKAMSDVIMRIKKRFEQENFSIAYPVTTVDFGIKGGVSLFDKKVNVDIGEK
ncbi:MAG: mechanosensitive ion channel [Chitinophagales bacterium]